MLLFLYLWGCLSEQLMTFGKVNNEIEYVYVQDNYIGGSTDTGEREPIWVDSFVQPIISNGVDVFWVIDGSGSMQDDHAMILQGIAAMMQNLPSINWRLMIISSHPVHQPTLTSFPLLPGDDVSDALTMFSQNVTGTSEEGFESLYRYITTNPFSSQWMREDAALLVVFVSDEDDQSSTRFPIASLFYDWLSSLRNEVYVSSIINLWPVDSECNNYTQNVGQRYIEITNLFSGNIVDICSGDWSEGVADASSQLQLREWVNLTYVPISDQYIYVFVNGIAFHDWTYNAADNRIYFSVIPPEESLVEIAYYY